MSEEFSEIRPKSVPLSHSAPAQQTSESSRATLNRVAMWALAAIVVALAVIVFWVLPDMVQPVQTSSPTASPLEPAERPGAQPGTTTDSVLPPFQALLEQQARKKAQDELANFVELQLRLEQQMQVGAWGQSEYDNAKLLATTGDEHFVKEDFEVAIASYVEASSALAGLIETGEGLFGEALAVGLQALMERHTKLAVAQFDRALTIDPNDPDALHGQQRAELLPQINATMREAKNFELAGDFRNALDAYRRVQTLDPETFGLDAALGVARQGLKGEQIKEHLSTGFSALDKGQLTAAQRAFNAALGLEPGNPVALGGLEQTAQKTASNRIERLRRAAGLAEQAEDWNTALEKYQEVLASDANIQFAREGRTRANTQRRAATGLSNVIASPEKLSSAQLYAQAKELLADATALTPRGPLLAAKLDTVDSLITAYREPVAVTFVSDNATQITLSTVGKLGIFDQKQLNLRPGAYTVMGSRDGCRDIREQIVVRPNMKPIDIRCSERL
jgi:tetratricopeptide (TPR) repeat protein